MITDEQIKTVFVSHGFKLSNETGDDLKPYVYAAAHELIALAQEVKELEWTGRSAVTSIGEYVVFNFNKQLAPLAPGYYALYLNQDPLQKCESEEAAKAAAQADFERRVKECLK